MTLESKYVNEECLQEWKGSNAGFKVADPVPMGRFLYELCCAVVRGDLPTPKCKAALDSVVFVEEQQLEDMSSVLADTIAHMGQDITMPGENRARLIKLTKWLVDSSLVPSRLLQERCEEDFLWESDLSKIKGPDLKMKEVRVNTRLLYQQTKFNLLREESEGYAKLVTLLCQGVLEGMSANNSTVTISTIKSLIGHFDLDPNRVFDIVLECFELYPDNHTFYDLIPIFPKSHAAQILGFKFQYYQRLEVNSPAPPGLFRLTALLVKAEFIDLDSICSHLLPKDDEAFELYDGFVARRLDEVNKIGKINLAATGKDLMDDEKQDVAIDLFASLDMESEAIKERVPEVGNNQKLGLLIGFLSVDDWYHAQILLDRLSRLNPVEHIDICDGLFRLIKKTMSRAYDLISQTSFRSLGSLSYPCSDSLDATVVASKLNIYDDLPQEFFQMIAAVGPYLYRDTILLQKVCILLRAYYVSAQDISSTVSCADLNDAKNRDPRFRAKEARHRVEEALGTCLLPSLQMVPANPAVGQEIWNILSMLPYEARYRLYGEWEKEDEQNPILLAARQLAKLDTRRILKRLAKENLKQLSRMVAKLAHSNPMTVLRTIVQQIEAYKDMITPVVDAFKYLTQLEYDMLEYVVIERLVYGGRSKLKDDGLNLSDWLQSLASFWGHLCKKYPSMELRGLFQYLVNQLKKGTGIELVLLQELIQQMANMQYTENMTEEQLDAMSGSETLRYQATLFGMTKNNKVLSKSTNRLRDALLPKEEPKLAIPLLVLIAHHRSMVVMNADASYIKMVSEQFDRCHGTLLQYVDFLCNALAPAAYAQLIPSLDELVQKYHLDPEVAFLVYRPVMRLFKRMHGSDSCWPLDTIDHSNNETEENEVEPSNSSNDVVLDLGSPWRPIMWSDLLATVQSMLPSKAWNSLSPDLYATFWGLTLYDLHVPRNRYEAEIAKQQSAMKALEEISDNSSIAITKRKKDKEKIQEVLDRLTSEFQKHEQHVSSVLQRLAREKDKWLSSCPDTLKINMEFLQRCIFPRCTFSMQDAVYCANFVFTLHSLGTPYFNTVNHIDVLICKTLQPMICCCTEYEAGRLGRFLYETLKMAYHWKSDESIYENECGNMPGFAVYYRFPNSQRVTYSQFVRVHFKWNTRITRLLVQCLESSEYMEIRNALIVLTKISNVFPVTRKSGLNLEKRVTKIKGDEREDLKVLATGVAAALAARKSLWVSEEEFGMGIVELKSTASAAKSVPGNFSTSLSTATLLQRMLRGPNSSTGNQMVDPLNTGKEHIQHMKSTDRTDGGSVLKPDSTQPKVKTGLLANGQETNFSISATMSKNSGLVKNIDESMRSDDVSAKAYTKGAAESDTRVLQKRASIPKLIKQEVAKEDNKSGKPVSRSASQQSSISADKDAQVYPADNREGGTIVTSSAVSNGISVPASTKTSVASTRMNEMHENVETSDASIRQQKRTFPGEEQEKTYKRKKGETETKDGEITDVRVSDKERGHDARAMDKSPFLEPEKPSLEEQSTNRSLDKSKDKTNERHEKDHREKSDRTDKDLHDKSRDRSLERHGRERSIEKMQDRSTDRNLDRSVEKAREDRSKDDRTKPRHTEISTDKTHLDERFHGQSLPPPPPLPPSFVPQSVGSSRRDDETDRRTTNTRHIQRLSPRHDEKERRRSEENTLTSQDDSKRRREDDYRERKRDERDGPSVKMDDRERDKVPMMKDDTELIAGSKRRKLKREHMPETGGEYSQAGQLPSSLASGMPQLYDGRERADKKAVIGQQRAAYIEEAPRIHGKEAVGKINRRESDQLHEREWEEEKRRPEAKRKHRK
ncbi:THO complex subunit 2-like isoform X1 [Zingiber officinale]|uniref:THO complex subunit 2-like isoform X1 n=1 Tax=Zingiber officinale TaxID=94328 RepID=UPI001C4C4427|nr:THO complex subunit 2-like isoform X1 [Zingiber officinale]